MCIRDSSSSEKWKEKEPAMELYNKVKAAGCATVTKAERKEKTEETPLLYDLTTLCLLYTSRIITRALPVSVPSPSVAASPSLSLIHI